jgi:hypothetical protein
MSQVFALSFVSLHVFQYIKIVDFKVVYESLIAWNNIKVKLFVLLG